MKKSPADRAGNLAAANAPVGGCRAAAVATNPRQVLEVDRAPQAARDPPTGPRPAMGWHQEVAAGHLRELVAVVVP